MVPNLSVVVQLGLGATGRRKVKGLACHNDWKGTGQNRDEIFRSSPTPRSISKFCGVDDLSHIDDWIMWIPTYGMWLFLNEVV